MIPTRTAKDKNAARSIWLREPEAWVDSGILSSSLMVGLMTADFSVERSSTRNLADSARFRLFYHVLYSSQPLTHQRGQI